MNTLMKNLLAATLVLSSSAVCAAAISENTDDTSTLGAPSVERQTDRADKRATGVNQAAAESDASHLGNTETPQIKKQMGRANKGLSERIEPNRKNKALII